MLETSESTEEPTSLRVMEVSFTPSPDEEAVKINPATPCSVAPAITDPEGVVVATFKAPTAIPAMVIALLLTGNPPSKATVEVMSAAAAMDNLGELPVVALEAMLAFTVKTRQALAAIVKFKDEKVAVWRVELIA